MFAVWSDRILWLSFEELRGVALLLIYPNLLWPSFWIVSVGVVSRFCLLRLFRALLGLEAWLFLGIESGLCCLACSRCCGLLALSFSSGLWALSNGAQLSFWFWSLGYVFDP